MLLHTFFAAAGLTAGLAAGAWVEPRSLDTNPMQLHLAYAGPTGMMVSWNTFSKLNMPQVNYGLAPNALDSVAMSNVSVTYQTSTTYNNHVKITGLQPDTVYYFQPQFSNVTNAYSFRTSRVAGDQTPMTVAVVVDLGTMGSGMLHKSSYQGQLLIRTRWLDDICRHWCSQSSDARREQHHPILDKLSFRV